MGAIRGFFVVIISVLLFLSLLSVTLLGIVSSSLNYETLQRNSAGIIKDSLENGFNLENEISKITPTIQLYCTTNNVSDYVFFASGYTFDIPCDAAMQGEDEITEEAIKDLVHNVYYTKYECTFFECIKESPFFLVSEKSYEYFNNKFFLLLSASLILAIGLFFLVERKTNTFIIAGSSMIISAVLFFKMDYFLSLFPNQIILQLLRIFFSESFSVSVNVLIVGIILLVIGLIFKIFKIGFKIQELISKLKEQQSIQKKKQKPIQKIVQKSAKTPPIIKTGKKTKSKLK